MRHIRPFYEEEGEGMNGEYWIVIIALLMAFTMGVVAGNW
jgi:hypothetical protein